jgi:hypothetical protein
MSRLILLYPLKQERRTTLTDRTTLVLYCMIAGLSAGYKVFLVDSRSIFERIGTEQRF